MTASVSTVVRIAMKYVSPKATSMRTGMDSNVKKSILTLCSAYARMRKGSHSVWISCAGTSLTSVVRKACSKKVGPAAAAKMPSSPPPSYRLMWSICQLMRSSIAAAGPDMLLGMCHNHCSNRLCLSYDNMGLSATCSNVQYECNWMMVPGYSWPNLSTISCTCIASPSVKLVAADAHWRLHRNTTDSRFMSARCPKCSSNRALARALAVSSGASFGKGVNVPSNLYA
mmetsp:Transcript_103491/g.316832  ORF Transcript_103491/g.316832 Transcript_103491/m.316832 type:complete len:228 (+) Transcript_103491:391-1074(+)